MWHFLSRNTSPSACPCFLTCCIADTHRFPGPRGRQHSTVHIHMYGLFSHSPGPIAVLVPKQSRHVWNATKFANSVSLQCVILHKGLFTGRVWPQRWQRWGAATGGKHSATQCERRAWCSPVGVVNIIDISVVYSGHGGDDEGQNCHLPRSFYGRCILLTYAFRWQASQ